MLHPSRLLPLGLVVLALGFLAPDSWGPYGEAMKWIAIFLLMGSIYHDVRVRRKREK